MNIDIVRQGMLKEAALGKPTTQVLKEFGKRYFPRVAQRIARGAAQGGKNYPSFAKAMYLRRLLAAAAKDSGAAALNIGGDLVRGTGRALSGLGDFSSELVKRNFLTVLLAGIPLGAYTTKRWFPGAFDIGASKVRDVINNTRDYINDTKNGVGTRVIAGPQGSVASLFNPVSGLTGGVDYVPKSYIDFVQKYIPGDAGKTTAHLTMKGGAMALLAAGLVGSYRAARHLGDLRSIDKADRPSKDLASQLSTTFEGDLSGEPEERQKKAASEEPGAYDIVSPGNFSAQNLTATAIPVGSLLLAAGLAYKGVDAVFDKIRNKRLDSAIAEKEQAVKKLITARAQIAKGGQAMESASAATAPLADSSVYTKAASQEKIAIIPETVQLFGTLSAAVILASALGSYAYTSASDEDNLKYKAYKKALKEYAKAKSGMTPITMAPSGASDYFAKIDAAKQGQPTTARQLPSYDSDSLNKPISVSF